MKKVAILTDTASNYSLDQAREDGVFLVPLTVNFSDGSYRDLYELTGEDMIKKLDSEGGMPSTSAPSPGDVLKIIDYIRKEGYEEILALSFPYLFSSSHQIIEKCLEESGMDFRILDTKRASFVQINYCKLARYYFDQGWGLNEVADLLEDRIPDDSGIYIVLKNLDYLINGGRLSKFTGKLGTALNINPICSFREDGSIAVTEKTRGLKRSIYRMRENVEKNVSGKRYNLYMAYGRSEDELVDLKEEMKDLIRGAEKFEVGRLANVILAHTGPEFIATAYSVLD